MITHADIVILREYVTVWFGAATLRAQIFLTQYIRCYDIGERENVLLLVIFITSRYFGLFYARIGINGYFSENITWDFIMNPGSNVSTFQCYWNTFGFMRSGLRAKARVTDSIIGWEDRKIRLLKRLLRSIKILITESHISNTVCKSRIIYQWRYVLINKNFHGQCSILYRK